MIVLTINGVNYQYPEIDDEDWGVQATQYAQAVSNILAHVFSPNLPIATSGQFRLGNNDTITWRNAANSANLSLRANASNKLIFNDGVTDIDLTLVSSGNVQHLATSTDNAVVRFDGPTGVSIQNSGVIIDDSNNITGVNNMTGAGDIDMSTGTIDTLDGTDLNYTNIDVTDLDINGSNFEDLIVNPVPTAVDNRLVKLDGISGQDFSVTGITVSDLEDVSGINDLSVGGDVTISGTGTHSVSAEFSTEAVSGFTTIPSAQANIVVDTHTRARSFTPGAVREVVLSNQIVYSTTSGTEATVTNSEVQITTSGRPVVITLVPNPSVGLYSYIYVSITSGTGTMSGYFQLQRDGADICNNILLAGEAASASDDIAIPPGALYFIDNPAAGTYTYRLRAAAVAVNSEIGVEYCRLLAYEL